MTRTTDAGPSSVGGGPAASSRRGLSNRPLTDKQLDVLRRTASGETHKQIARELGIDLKTVGGTFQEIFRKLGGVETAPQAVDAAYRLGVLRLELDSAARDGWPWPLLQVLELVADGRTNADIARILGRSEHTVVDQVKEARRRLGARDRAHAVALAIGGRLIRAPQASKVDAV
ncbi:response regulator transcription factor [Streptomyces sp. NPDC015346]|uniref:response regulator transcription factor n=1 Tax=Streptomyces sp. NPDC015346 TaxID=3364954 RepID=UPI0036FBF8F4